MTNPFIPRHFRRLLFTAAFAFIQHSQSCNAQTGTNLRTMREMVDAIQSGTVTDNALIESIAQRLDALVGKSDNSAIKEKAQLISIASFVQVNLDAARKQAVIRQRSAVLQQYLAADLNATTDGSALLYLASGMVGLPIDQKRAMAFAKAASTPYALRLQAMEAILNQSQISAEIQSDLAELSKDDWHVVDTTDVGPHSGGVIYPIREMALKIIQKRDGNGSATR